MDFVTKIKSKFRRSTVSIIYYVFGKLPKKNKVIATAFKGRKYGDNTQYIIETLHKINPKIELVWLVDDDCDYDVPSYVRKAPYNRHPFKRAYEYATSKVWLDTHRLIKDVRKNKGQIFFETWHGGIAIKKLDGDVPKFRADKTLMAQLKRTADSADLYISNSNQLTEIYRRAFYYNGPVWKCGYPRNDILFEDSVPKKNKICEYCNISKKANILLYAPTFRDSFLTEEVDIRVYDVDYERLHETLAEKFGGEWYILVRMHPFLVNSKELFDFSSDYIINVTSYPDMQELICACDAILTDYSSCIFEAALKGKPCFTYAKDFESYKGDRGAYFEMEELPFPYAKNNDELMESIVKYDKAEYKLKWDKFVEKTGFYETGHAAKDIAYVINEFIKGNSKPLEQAKKGTLKL